MEATVTILLQRMQLVQCRQSVRQIASPISSCSPTERPSLTMALKPSLPYPIVSVAAVSIRIRQYLTRTSVRPFAVSDDHCFLLFDKYIMLNFYHNQVTLSHSDWLTSPITTKIVQRRAQGPIIVPTRTTLDSVSITLLNLKLYPVELDLSTFPNSLE